MSKSSSGGSVGFAIFVLLALLAQIPKPVWIALGIAVGVAAVCWFVYACVEAWDQHLLAKEEQARIEHAEAVAAAKREREEKARRLKQHRLDTLGKDNAARLESALSAVRRIAATEAARDGWLGDVDFTADIQAITANFEQVHALRAVTGKLSALSKPSADDRRILAEAKATADTLERAAVGRVNLISKCAKEAQLIDESLREEREDARVAEKRAELHGKLSAMLYGIEATPDNTPENSAVDTVMARVAAYREIKQQIRLAGAD
ncbi:MULTISPECIES: tripartite tricarboxylate transporter TctB family protein [Mycobacteriaceae]|uniref:tripartite tricarboxylate transporter TctB family protein n=1 Tax=Mycobacteriaceae TaxID=1762 RepID=UPI0007FF6A93|nr:MULTISPECIES: tripartite tricarboxylate transporter TctB family protein [Mycobacteriaceae]MCK0173849.1 tripartite tricarboxylate transporter TctB family protein [Mycolicibacterium sp. F2034L]OBB57109.1 hypothetical protein A5757_20975 [Mycobacterium sp. 852013-51886_SCH5428379]